MEPRKEVLKKEPEHRKDQKMSRFQILKLEQRIAPGCFHHPHGNNNKHCPVL